MDRFIALGLILILIFYGAFKNIIILLDIKKKEEFSITYRNKLVNYSNSGSEEDFNWLAINAMKMQDYMRGMGIMSYKPPFANYYINNYLVIINGIDEIRNERTMGMGYNEHAHMLVDAVMKYYGSLGYNRERIVTNMRNPLKLITGSINSILMLPFALLREVGLFSSRLYEIISNSIVVRIVTAIATLISVISAVVSLVIGWDEFLKIIERFVV